MVLGVHGRGRQHGVPVSLAAERYAVTTPADIDAAIARARRELDRAPAPMRDHFSAVVELLEQLRDRRPVTTTLEEPRCP